MRNTLKYYENKVAFEPKYGRTYEKYRFEKSVSHKISI